MRKKMILSTFIIIIVFLLSFLDKILNFIVNVQWFKEVGYLPVYFTKLIALLQFLVPLFIISFLAIWFYYKSIRKNIIKIKKIYEIVPSHIKLEKRIFILVDIIVSFIIAFSVANNYWYRILQFKNSVPFKVKDPIFNMDISFYVFKLPLLKSIYIAIMTVLFLLVIVTFILYFLLNIKDNIRDIIAQKNIGMFKQMKSGITKFAGRQLAIVSALILLMLSFGYLIKGYDLVYSSRGVVFGASYTDIHVSLNFYRVIAVVSLIASVVIFLSIIASKIKPIIISIAVIFILIISENIASLAVENLVVKSNQRGLESKYIKYNIEYTKKAFNIDNLKEQPFKIENNLTYEDIKNNKETINNIKINSFKPALEFYNQVESLKYYYDFKDIDIDRYNINGKYNQVFLAPREIDKSTLKNNADTWQSRHLLYTHGYGIVMSKVNSVTAEGQPDFIINNIPPKNNTDIKIDNPRIYFGENTNDYAIVNNKLGEVDYPVGGQNKTTNYNGKAGINMSFANRLLFAINERNIKFILSGDIKQDSKILINRNVVDRVKKIAPFLTYDKDPYVVIKDGKMVWVIDAYTTTDKYPFSEPINGINYIRNSVKATVDAVDGTTNFYIVDKNDPIAQNYSNIFPGLFKDTSSVPKEIKEHFRYPEDLFNIQSKVLGKYHVTNPDSFFDGSDLWQIAENEKNVQSEKEIAEPSFVTMKLPGEQKEEMVILHYFNMRNKDNMTALFGARMDGDNYGKLVLYKLPTDKTIYSPYLFQQTLKQDTTISKEITLLDAQGSNVKYGDTVIVPIKNSLLYVEPLYVRATGNKSIPEVKKIIVFYDGKIVMRDNIEDALKSLFGEKEGTQEKVTQEKGKEETTKIDGDKNIDKAKDLYNKAVEAQKNGDWAKYGEYIKELGEALNK